MTGPHIVIPLEASPLTWPAAVKRTKAPQSSRFVNPTIGAALGDIRDELRKMGATDIVISTNLPLRRDGEPYSRGINAGEDQGAAVYWVLTHPDDAHMQHVDPSVLKKPLRKTPYCLPCDKWRTLPENLHAIALTINALRAVERYGAIHVVQAFEGFKALPTGDGSSPTVALDIDWREALGGGALYDKSLNKEDLLDLAKTRYRRLSKEHHPDHTNVTDTTRIAELNAAWELAQKELQ